MVNKRACDEKRSSAGVNSEMNKITSSEECRACLQPTGCDIAYNLFESWVTPWSVRGAIIADDLSKFADVEITESDKYSKVICSKCYNRLSDACTFMITVQMSDSILRQRVENSDGNITGEGGTSWPQPILLNKSTDIDVDNNIEVEVKQEVLSDDNGDGNGAEMDQDWEPTMDIKIEPEEITAPVQSNAQVNGVPEETLDETTDSTEDADSNKHTQDDSLDKVVKQEPLSSDDLLEPIPDLPLDCMLCFKVFNTMSGLKAHVISQHSYKSVKRKAVACPSPVKNKMQVKEHACNLCDQIFTTSTDLMVHGASHSEHICYVCDRNFNSFQQLMRHTPRCQKKHTSVRRRDLTRLVPRPQQVLQPTKAQKPARAQQISQPVNNISKTQKQPTRMEETKTKSENLAMNSVVATESSESSAINDVVIIESKSLVIEDSIAIESEDPVIKAITVTETRSLAIEPAVAAKPDDPEIEAMEATESEVPTLDAMIATVSEGQTVESMEATESKSLAIKHMLVTEAESPTIEVMIAAEDKRPATEDEIATEYRSQAINEMIAPKSESPAIEDMIAGRVQELVETWPSNEEMDMDVELSQTQTGNKLECTPQFELTKEQQNVNVIKDNSTDEDIENRLSAIFNGPCIISEEETSKIEPSIEITQKSVQQRMYTTSKVESEEETQAERSLTETKKSKMEESKLEIQIEVHNEPFGDTTSVESIEEIKKYLNRGTVIEDSVNDLKIDSTKIPDQAGDRDEDMPSIFPEDTISNTVQNVNQDGLSLYKLSSESQNESNLLFESVPNLTNQDNSEDVLTIDSSESLKQIKIEIHNIQTGEELEQSNEQNAELENLTQNKDNNVPISNNLDEISEMKVHLAINPLNKDTVIFEAETDVIECGE